MRQKMRAYKRGESVYRSRPDDPNAVCLTSGSFPVKGDGISDDTAALQLAINTVKDSSNYGIVFIPEGTYRISRTIYIPRAVRLIGYGKNRPLLVLGKNTPGYQEADPLDKGQANYMLWFTDSVPGPDEPVKDANAGTFYSALSNINLKISEGNPCAVALRTHFAQHCFISHADIDIGEGKAGIFDVGNEIEDVCFYGGKYGIYTTKTSAGWPFLMIDTYFEGQKKAAVLSREAGLTVIRMEAREVPLVVDTERGFVEKLYMEDCRFENIGGPAIRIRYENNAGNQLTLRNIQCRNVPKLACFVQSGRSVNGIGDIYRVNTLLHGYQMDDPGSRAETKTVLDMEPMDSFPTGARTDLLTLPPVKSWVSVKSAGARGDGETDDTRAIQEAIDKYPAVYMPLGLYRVSGTIRLKADTVLIGLHPIGTRLLLRDNEEAFGGFGGPKALLETSKGGRNIVAGIGLDAGGRNPRVVACKWMAGADSYMNDVKLVGGHGGMSPENGRIPVYNETRTADADPDRKWDSQYWSLWVTDGGGGVFKDIWSASPYASAGLYVSDTSTPGCIYAMSIEHHVRSEAIFKNASNWKMYAFQMEEEAAESRNCQPLEIIRCRDMLFANLYFFRVIWVDNPYSDAIRTWDAEGIEFFNVYNYTQTKYTIDNTLHDINTGLLVRPWQIAAFRVSGDALCRTDVGGAEETREAGGTGMSPLSTPELLQGVPELQSDPSKPQPNLPKLQPNPQKLRSGFEFIDAVCRDSRGNIYFCDSRRKSIYRWSVETDSLDFITNIHYKPLSLACDTADNLIVVAEYFPPKGATINGQPEVYPKPTDAEGISYGVWYNTGSTVKLYAINPSLPEESMQVLEPVPMDDVPKVHKALYPANRWRDNNDYLAMTVRKLDQCYVAPDGVTIIPVNYDLIRASSLLEAFPGKPFFAVDEYYKRTVSFRVDERGRLSMPMVFKEKGEHSVAADSQGNVYIPDGEIYVYNPAGAPIGEIRLEDRPCCVILGGKDGRSLFVTARSSFYRINGLPW
jgi:sugar lactone lactonase YvrE